MRPRVNPTVTNHHARHRELMTTPRDAWPPPATRAPPPLTPFEPRYAFARDVTAIGRPRETPTSQTTMTGGAGAGTGLLPFPFANAPPSTIETTPAKRGRSSEDDLGLVLPGAFGDGRLGSDDAFVERFRFNGDIFGTTALGHHSLDSSKQQVARSQADNSAPLTMTLPGGTSEGCEFARCSGGGGGGPSAGDSAMREAAFHEEARASMRGFSERVETMRRRQNDLSDEMAGVKRMLMDIMTTQSNLLAALASSRRPFDDGYVDDRDVVERMRRRATPNGTGGRDDENDDAHRVSVPQPRTTTPSNGGLPHVHAIANDVDDDDDDDEEEETKAAGAELTESELRKRVLSRMLAHQRRRRNDNTR